MTPSQFAKLYEENRERVVRSFLPVMRSIDEAEDVAAAAFAAAYRKRDSFRGESSFGTWMHAIAHNEARKLWRRNQGVVMESIDAENSRKLVEPDLLTEVIHRSECCLKLKKVMRKVPRKYRRVLICRFVKKFSTREIAKREKIPQGTVLSRIFTGKRLLRKAWGYAQ